MSIGKEKELEILRLKADGYLIRPISKITKISRNTVRKVYYGERQAGQLIVRHQEDSEKKQAVLKDIRDYLTENQNNWAVKQKLTAQMVYDYLKKNHTISVQTVSRYLREMKEDTPKAAFIPLYWRAAETMQVDWTEVWADVWNESLVQYERVKIYVFSAVLMYSYTPFIGISVNKQTDAFLELHTQAMEYYGGIPQVCIYDNDSVIVANGSGKSAIETQRFQEYRLHYGFRAEKCTARQGHEKGAVENLCDLSKRLAFTPIRKWKSLELLQDHAREKCIEYMEKQKVVGFRPRSVKEMYFEEKPLLQPLPRRRFEAYKEVQRTVGSDLMIEYDTTCYSVPVELSGMKVTIRITPTKLLVFRKGMVWMEHRRPFRKGDNQIYVMHYMPLLKERPRAVKNALPLAKGILPAPEFTVFREKCKAKEPLEQLFRLLLLIETVDMTVLRDAIAEVIVKPYPTYEKVVSVLMGRGIQTPACKEEADNQQKEDATEEKSGLDKYENWFEKG